MEIRRVVRENAKDLLLKNELFSLPGRFIPELRDGVWSYRTEPYETVETMCFPDEAYDFDRVSQKGCALAAYDGGVCVGLIVLEDRFWKYMHVYDLKVAATARNKGVGKALVRAALEEACRRDYRGLYLEAQDNNLNACLFYVKTGFVIGGFDNRLYAGTRQEGKADVTFYLDGESR